MLDCSSQLFNQLNIQSSIIEKELFDYNKLFAELIQPDQTEINHLETQLVMLQLEENELIKKLEYLNNIDVQVLNEKDECFFEESILLSKEQIYLREYSNLKKKLFKSEIEQESLDHSLKIIKSHLNRIQKLNVLNACFHIWYQGNFGTINNFRLGYLPQIKIEWDEVNAGLGQVNFLLDCLARQLNFTFQTYRLLPFGNFSCIEVIETNSNSNKGNILRMYRSKYFSRFSEYDDQFDMGMIAFLEMILQFENKIKSIDYEFLPPYNINGHKIEDKNASVSYSVKCQLNSCENWTRALKYMLTNLKWCMAWVSLKKKS